MNYFKKDKNNFERIMNGLKVNKHFDLENKNFYPFNETEINGFYRFLK